MFSIIEQFLFVVVMVAGAALAGYGVWIKYRLVSIGAPTVDNRFPKDEQIPERALKAFYHTFSWAFRGVKPWVGIMHTFVYGGFIAFLIATTNHTLKIFVNDIEFSVLSFSTTINDGYALLVDIFAVLVMYGIVSLGYRRYVKKPKSLYPPPQSQKVLVNEHSREDTITESLITILFIFFLMVSYITTEGIAMAIAGHGFNDMWRPVSATFGSLVGGMGEGPLAIMYHLSWWAHILLVIGFAVYVPFSKHLHLAAGPVNLFFKRQAAYGKTDKQVDLIALFESEEEDEDEEFNMGGIQYLQDLPWKNLLDTFACIECGRCDDICPANRTGSSLSPKWLIVNTKHLMMDEEKDTLLKTGKSEIPLFNKVISEDAAWACTTCGGCMEMCPMSIEHIPYIMGLRQHQLMEEEESPKEFNVMRQNLERQGNPWGQPQSKRDEWAKDLNIQKLSEVDSIDDIDVLYWVGCAGSYDDGARKVAVAFSRIMQEADVKFAILGKEEKCCGDPARRCGDEYLAQSLIEENVEVLNDYGVKKVVTACPHCLHTLKNEFPDWGGHFEVKHHSQVINELVLEGKLRVNTKTSSLLATFHDPCYLGRHNDVIDEPREVLTTAGYNQTEMELNGRRGFCCGAGGAQMWKEEEEKDGPRVNEDRTRQALETGADVIGVGCPFCKTMLVDGVNAKGKGEDVAVKDIAELIFEKFESKSTAATDA